MNKHYNETCIKCRNNDDCVIAKTLKESGDDFDLIILSGCLGFVEITPNVIHIYACKDCKNRGYTDSADYCGIYKMDEPHTFKQINNVNTIPNWCKRLKQNDNS